MKKLAIAIPMLIAGSFANAQMSLQDQINAVNQAQNDRKAQEAAELAAQREAAITEQRTAEARQRAAEAGASAARARADKARADQQAKAQAAAAAREQERMVDKQRNQSYEDQLRALELEERRAEVDARKAKAKRADDFIDAELSRQKAETDVVQSGADARRNESEGSRDMMKGIGKGAESKSWNPFK